MSKLTEKLYALGAYFLTGINIAWDFESVKSVVLFIGALTLLVLQIRLHLIRIEQEKDNLKKN